MNRRRRMAHLILVAAAALCCDRALIAADSPATTSAATTAPAAERLGGAEVAATQATASTGPSTAPTTGATTTTASATEPTTRPAGVASAGPSGRFDSGRGNGRFGDRGQGRNSNGGVGGGGAPPSTGPVFQLKPMANDFAILNTRSIFVHGRLRDEQPSRPVEQGPQPTPEQRAQQTLVFNGVTRADGLITQVTAILEDTAASKIISAQLGDQIAGGVVTNITLDKLEFTPASTGKPVTVLIGQNLQAGEAPRPAATSASASASGGATTGPSTPPAGTGGPLTRQPGESVADWLRRRRAAGQ
jgi:hypothetical protein